MSLLVYSPSTTDRLKTTLNLNVYGDVIWSATLCNELRVFVSGECPSKSNQDQSADCDNVSGHCQCNAILGVGDKVCMWFSFRKYHIFYKLYTNKCMHITINVRQVIVDNNRYFLKHLLRYWPIFALSSTLNFAGAVNTRQKMTVHINNLSLLSFQIGPVEVRCHY